MTQTPSVRKPWTLSEQLAELERTDPAVGEAARRYDEKVSDLLIDAQLSEASRERKRPVYVYYRCDRCGAMEAGEQFADGGESGPPINFDCGCYMGPRWVRGIWRAEP